MAELRSVTAPGGAVHGCHFDGFAVTHWPEDRSLQATMERVFPVLVDPFIGRKTAFLFAQAGLVDLTVQFEPDRLYTVVGRIDPERRRNWVDQLVAARPHIARIFGGEHQAEAFADAFLGYLDRADTASYTALYLVSGIAPGHT